MNGATHQNDIYFKIRFNTTHGDTDLFWRIIINDTEHLATAVSCSVPTWSESSFDQKAGAIKWHMAGKCTSFIIDENRTAILN
jgi:hypothetical protein